MKKPIKISKKTVPQKEVKPSQVNEPVAPYKSLKAVPQLKDFNYTEFKKIADKTPFTQAEWASILHLSERTLQRYAKDNGSFAAINAERALQIDKVIKEGKIAFGNIQNFYNWLKRNPSMLEGTLSLESLHSLDGIEKVLTQLGRIQHGLFA
ncbi:MAG: antitoxin Xre-like helix-turn-helix domain-containing protein [Ferruginibacter sp.]